MGPAFRAFFSMLILVGIAGVISYVFHSGEVARLQQQNLIITPDTFSGTGEIELGRIVEITGTPDLLNAVSLEERNSEKALSYYVPLKEYGTNFVVQMKRERLTSDQQVFIGEVNGINKTEFEKRIKTVLNKPVELSDDDRAELDPETIELLVNETTKDFPNKALIVVDGQIPENAQIVSGVVFWATIISIALITLFRRRVFKDILF